MSILKSLPVQLSLCLFLAISIGDLIPYNGIRFVYTLSVNFKELLLTFLPLIIFSFISSAVLQLDKRAPYLITALIVLVTLSNATAISLSYAVTRIFIPNMAFKFDLTSIIPKMPIEAFYMIPMPKIMDSDKVMMAAILFGLIMSYYKQPVIHKSLAVLHRIVTFILAKCFIPLLPIYITGFALKMKYEGDLVLILSQYLSIFMIIVAVILSYLLLVYYISANLNFKRMLVHIRTMLPAGLTGLATMSSIVTLPVTLTCADKNIGNPSLTNLVIPTTTNIHMLGDALSIPILTFGVMHLFGQPIPSLQEFITFIPAFCIAKFSLAAIPGGTIIIMLPILQTHFNLSLEAASLITTLYILQDPLFTFGNVMGNGAFAIVCHKIFNRLKLQLEPQTLPV